MGFLSLLHSASHYATSPISTEGLITQCISTSIPLERYFPEYVGGNNVQNAARFILWKFMQANHAGLSMYPQ
ncbi:hypothetical protein B0H13DRAFT_2340356 [Mycena leptocephala]|nr:hypothetical protein B0H13DRAFT_2340356 [Mycena leptocephala]